MIDGVPEQAKLTSGNAPPKSLALPSASEKKKSPSDSHSDKKKSPNDAPKAKKPVPVSDTFSDLFGAPLMKEDMTTKKKTPTKVK